MSCGFCKKESSAKFEEPTAKEPLWRPIEVEGEGEGAKWQTLCVLDFRGLEPVGFEASVSYQDGRDNVKERCTNPSLVLFA